jgi:hypothetical protein
MSASNFDACTTTHSIKKPTTNPAISFAGGSIADAYSSGTARSVGLVFPKLKFPLTVLSVTNDDAALIIIALPTLISLPLKTLLLFFFFVVVVSIEETAQRQGTQTSIIFSLSLSLSLVYVYTLL